MIFLLYNGNPKRPERRGFITGVTRPPGLAPGESVEITDQMLRSLKRPTEGAACESFATMLAGIYNSNLPYEKWAVVCPEAKSEAPAPGGTIPPLTESESEVQSEEEPFVGHVVPMSAWVDNNDTTNEESSGGADDFIGDTEGD